MRPIALIGLVFVRFTGFRVSKINGINSLEITCFVLSIAISTKLLEIKYSDLYISKMVQNCSIEEVEYDQSSALLEVSYQNVMPR